MSSALFRAVTCASPSAYEDTERLLPAGVPVVLPLYAAASLAGVLQAAGKPAARVSQMGHYTRPYCGQDLAGKRLLAWRGCGVGDQLVFAGCLAYLATRYPSARLDLVCDPRIAGGIWAGAENLPFNVLAEPITLAAWDAYDYHWICNGHCDGDHEPNQPDIWSGHLRSIGHDNAPASARFPLLPQSAAWTARAREFAEDIGALPRAPAGELVPPRPPDLGAAAGMAEYCHTAAAPDGQPAAQSVSSVSSVLSVPPVPPTPRRPRLLWHLAASARIRSLSPELTRETLVRLHLDRPDIRVIVTGAAVQYAEYERACALPNVVADTGSLALPEVFALVGLVDALVCPDSCLGHVSAAFGTPTVSLWCPFPARARVLGYGNHRPIEARGACSPCWCHERGELDGALRQGCPLEPAGADSGRWCKGLQAIRPQEIVEAIKEIV